MRNASGYAQCSSIYLFAIGLLYLYLPLSLHCSASCLYRSDTHYQLHILDAGCPGSGRRARSCGRQQPPARGAGYPPYRGAGCQGGGLAGKGCALYVNCSRLRGSGRRAQCVDASSAADLDNEQRRLTSFAGATVVWIAIDYTAAGLAAVADQPRAGAAAAVRLSCCAHYPPMYCAGIVYAGTSAAVWRCCTLHIIVQGTSCRTQAWSFPGLHREPCGPAS